MNPQEKGQQSRTAALHNSACCDMKYGRADHSRKFAFFKEKGTSQSGHAFVW